MTITHFDPETWLETAVRGIKDYAEEGFKKSVRDDEYNFVGDEIYDIVMEYPPTDLILRTIPMNKIIVHFEIDDIDDRILGFGDGIFRWNYDPIFQLIQPQEAGEHRINFDVGLWVSDSLGGVTGRLRAYQTLRNLFQGPLAQQSINEATMGIDDSGEREGGLDILEFHGGRFFAEQINDVRVFRLINCMLVIRCFSRTPIEVDIPTIEEITQIPELIIDDHLQIPMGVTIHDEGTGIDSATKS